MTPSITPPTKPTSAPRTTCQYQGCRVSVRAFRLYGHLPRFRYTIRPTSARPTWLEFRCLTPFLTAEEALQAGKSAIDERLEHESRSALHRKPTPTVPPTTPEGGTK